MSKWIVSVLLLIELAVISISLLALGFCENAYIPTSLKNILFSILFGGLGGAVYCLRGIYLNACVLKQWDTNWLPWYFIRPFLSLALGGLSYLLIKSGLIFFNASQNDDGQLGIWLLAFIAGYNVDNTLQKIESIGHSTWGIGKSNQAKEGSKSND